MEITKTCKYCLYRHSDCEYPPHFSKECKHFELGKCLTCKHILKDFCNSHKQVFDYTGIGCKYYEN